MRLIGIGDAKPGDILGQTILSKDGSIMLRQNVPLTKRYIEKLRLLGITCLYIEDDLLDDIKPQDPKFLEIKSEAVKVLSKVFSRLEYGSNDTDIHSTFSIITELVEYLIGNKEIDHTYLVEIKTFDNYTYVHSLNTCVLSLFFGVQLGYSRSKLIDLGMGSMLHDIGKTRISKGILNKNGKLTNEEFDIIKKHPEMGYELVRDIRDIDERSKLVVLQHHEKIDGSGYPKGIKEDKISKFAKIACICDVYDAIVSDRVYRKRIPQHEAYEYILGGAGTFFDWELANVFRENFSLYPLGIGVKLSNGLEGFVVGHNKGFPDRPIVRILYNDKGDAIDPVELDMIEHIDVCIENIKI